MRKVNLQDALDRFSEHWKPRIVGELNGQHVKLAKFKGDFVWHSHDDEDELFYVVKGQMEMQLRDQVVTVGGGGAHHHPSGSGALPPSGRGGPPHALRACWDTQYR